ncbi:MAG: recombinase family protein [Actinomycetota bacterium]|nr:recombinase family protein [Actinomycetota bacterium]
MLLVDGYVRTGSQGPWSTARSSVDRRRITNWTAVRGWRLARIFEDRAPGHRENPGPGLRDALGRIESGESDGIVTTSLDQIGDSLGEVLDALERIQAAGGTFASVGDGIDLSTAAGHLILRVLVSVTGWWLP